MSTLFQTRSKRFILFSTLGILFSLFLFHIFNSIDLSRIFSSREDSPSWWAIFRMFFFLFTISALQTGLIIALPLFLYRIFQERNRTAVQKKISEDTLSSKPITSHSKHIPLTALFLGIIFLWISLFFSHEILPNAAANPSVYDSAKPCGTGGYPLQVFEYPCGALGGDWPHAQDVSWTNFFMNFLILLIPGFLIAFAVQRKQCLEKVLRPLCIATILFTFFGLIYIMFMFD